MQMLLAALSRRMSCSRARIVITNARLPSRSVVIPTRRPGIWRTSASVEARMPRYGPPYCGAIPSGWPSPAAMSAPYAPGGARTARLTGSMTATNRAPAACASRADLGHRLEQAEEVGLGGDDAGDRPVRVGQHPLERREVGRAGRLAVGHERDLVELEAAPEVGPRASRGSADGRRGRRGPARAGSPDRSSARPRPWPRRRRSATPRRRRGRPARPSATRTRRCSGACPG